MTRSLKQNLTLFIILLLISQTHAQFIDDFNTDKLALDPGAVNGWAFFSGDGLAEINFSAGGKGFASINVDATKDKQNIWWAAIRHRISEKMDLNLITNPDYEFRIEAKIKISSAPKRVNLHLNTQRTTDFHSHLMEFDIPDTVNWHTISMTTKNFNAVPGDSVYGQLALMDWGLEKYRVDIDYFKVDIVNVDNAEPDKGFPQPYHPPIPGLKSFHYHIPVRQDAIIDNEYSNMNFNNLYTTDEGKHINLLNVNGTQVVILKWNLDEFKGKRINGSGLLELTTYSVQRSSDYQKDFGMVRISEITGGDPEWNEKEITYENFCKGGHLNEVLNSQMIIDIKVEENKESKNLVTISRPVLQRLIDGKTLGLAIRSLGVVNASFFSKENMNEELSAKLHLNIEDDK